VNDWTFYGYPLKMHEYLACGKPTISTGLPEVIPYKDVIKIPKDYDQWLSGIDEYIKEDSEKEISKRLKVAKENSWSERVAKMLTVINKYATRSN
jgi:hypothetical protein